MVFFSRREKERERENRKDRPGFRLMPFLIDTGKPVFLPLRMSCFVLSNLVVTAGMLTPGLGVSICLQSELVCCAAD